MGDDGGLAGDSQGEAEIMYIRPLVVCARA